MIHMAEYTYGLRRGNQTRGVGGRSRGHVVRGRAWGKLGTRRPKLERDEMNSAGMV